MQTLDEHTGRVFRLQFDEFQIVSSSHDDTILIWDFFDSPSEGNVVRGAARIENAPAAGAGSGGEEDEIAAVAIPVAPEVAEAVLLDAPMEQVDGEE